ncbi:MAG: molybdopterin-guanine dinucleotide biosynthesis protein [Akkermansiaceae bacterium]|nr:molybdopterin-guanine dinucleotide biosynthesis protein [Akkermansiaceae bacterium]
MTPNILIVAGGRSARMGRDKATIERPGGTRQIDHLAALAHSLGGPVFLSAQVQDDRGTGLTVLPDPEGYAGPLAALAAARATGLAGPWLVLGCDLFLLDAATLAHLLAHRDPARAATAFRNRIDGRAEPLCTLYEPAALQALTPGQRCARSFLESLDPLALDLPFPAALDNANTPGELEEVFQKITRGVTAKAVRILYFAILREARGLSGETLETLAWTAAGLYEELCFRHRLPLEQDQLRIARNGEFESWEVEVRDGDEFIFIPPVAGG